MPKSRRSAMNDANVKNLPICLDVLLISWQDQPKIFNPFAAKSASEESAMPTPVFAFGSQAQTAPVRSDRPVVQQASGGLEFEQLKSMRGLNKSFQEAVENALTQDPFADLSIIFQKYGSHVETIKSKAESNGSHVESRPEENNKNAIKPIFAFGESSHTTDAPAKSSSSGNAPSIQFGSANSIATSMFDFKGTSTPTFSSNVFSVPTNITNGSQGEKLEVDPPQTKETKPIFTFGAAVSDTEKKETPKDFSWTPDKGIKFSNEPSTGMFQFVNPLASPSIQNEEPVENNAFKAASPSAGFSFISPSQPPTTSISAPSFALPSSEPKPAGFLFGSTPTPDSATPNPISFSFLSQQSGDQKDGLKPVEDAEANNEEGQPQDGIVEPHSILSEDEVHAIRDGEEDEDTVFSVRGKVNVLRSQANKNIGDQDWADLGVGEVRVNVHKETHQARVICRQYEGLAKVTMVK
jgi:hypothetical protein